MLNFETVKKYFNKGLWTAAMVASAVKKGKITAAEYQAITDQSYEG